MIYHAKLEEGVQKEYIRCTWDFKKRYYGHMESLRNEESKHKSTLSANVWEQGLDLIPERHQILWPVFDRETPYPGDFQQPKLPQQTFWTWPEPEMQALHQTMGTTALLRAGNWNFLCSTLAVPKVESVSHRGHGSRMLGSAIVKWISGGPCTFQGKNRE